MRRTPLSDEYVAGLIDGEGWVSVVSRYDHTGKSRVIIDVAMTCEPVIRALQDRFGGSVTALKAKNERCLPSWRWRVYGQAARPVLLAIRGRVIVKHDAVEDCIRFYQETGTW